jgi:hypothetical protein
MSVNDISVNDMKSNRHNLERHTCNFTFFGKSCANVLQDP